MNNKQILDNISRYPLPKRVKLWHDAQAHSAAQCNGDYYQDEETEEWHGYNHQTYKWDDGSTALTLAKRGAFKDKSIPKRIALMCGTENVPHFITWDGDSRGFVLKINADKMTEDEIKYTNDCGFMMDWGGDFTIIKNTEKQVL